MDAPYAADRSLGGKVRRRLARFAARRPTAPTLGRPTLSFTFDDVPESAVRNAAPLLEDEGLRATWYVCSGLFGRDGHMGRFADAESVSGLIARGHEIGCHTRDHIDCHRSGDDTLIDNVEANVAALKALGGEPRHFAFPYGELSARTKRLLGPRYGSLRGVHAGAVAPGDDLNQLPSVGFQGPDGEATANHWIDRVAASGGWLILFSHDVRDNPSPWGCTPAGLGRVVRRARDAGFAIRTVGEVLA